MIARVITPASTVSIGGSGGAGGSGAKGTSASDAGISCNSLKQTGGVTTDGLYWVKPASDPAFQVYCDMTTDGGGWTKLMHANMPNFFTSGNWASTGEPNNTTLYSILDKRVGFKTAGAYTFRLQIGRTTGSSTNYSANDKETIWKQTNDPATERTDGTGYQFISWEASTTCSGFSGLHQADNSSYSISSDQDSTESNSCWWMQIIPLIRYQSSNYLDGYGGRNNFHIWQVLWVK